MVVETRVAISVLAFMIDNDIGCRLLAKAIEVEPVKAYVLWWPWTPMGLLMRVLPLGLVRKLG